ncbi:MAG TPA: substrate-binding domain-containing protein, partial [Candidatus Brocadiia bacterium]|nr:substrate-binding domain-containing protein [Candidatus Brocadiia bacterium]
AEDLVHTVPGVGCVVAEPQAKWRVAGLLALMDKAKAPQIMEELSVLHNRFVEMRCDVDLRLVTLEESDDIDGMVAWAKRKDGVLMQGCVRSRLVHALTQAGVPVVTIGEPRDGPCPEGASMVTVDEAAMMRLAVSHLASLGHRRIGCANGGASKYYDALSAGFWGAMAEMGPEMRPSELRLDGDRCDRGDDVVDWLENAAQPPTALIIEGGDSAQAALQRMAARGWPVPGRISVLAITSTLTPPYAMKGMNAVFYPRTEMLARAVETLSRVLRSRVRATHVERMVARYVHGHTCRPVEAPPA